MTQTDTPFLAFWRAVSGMFAAAGLTPPTGGEVCQAWLTSPDALVGAIRVLESRLLCLVG